MDTKTKTFFLPTLVMLILVLVMGILPKDAAKAHIFGGLPSKSRIKHTLSLKEKTLDENMTSKKQEDFMKNEEVHLLIKNIITNKKNKIHSPSKIRERLSKLASPLSCQDKINILNKVYLKNNMYSYKSNNYKKMALIFGLTGNLLISFTLPIGCTLNGLSLASFLFQLRNSHNSEVALMVQDELELLFHYSDAQDPCQKTFEELSLKP